MPIGTVIHHSHKGFGFISAEGFPGNVFVNPAMMSDLARKLDVESLENRLVTFEAVEGKKPDGTLQWQVTSIVSKVDSNEALVEEILEALRPAIRIIVKNKS